MSLTHGETRKCEACETRLVGAVRPGDDVVAPVELLPSEGGNVLLWRDSGDGEPRYAIVGQTQTREYLRALGVPLRLNHFAACPERERFGRKG